MGGGGVQRIVKLLRYLPRERWSTEVLAMAPRPGEERDLEGARQLPEGLVVHRVASPLPTSPPGRTRRGSSAARPDRLYHLARTAAGLLCTPDVYLPWSLRARRKLATLLGSGRFDVVVSTSPPDSAHLAVAAAARRRRVPWVADFRDPWTRRIHFQPPTAAHRALDSALEARVIGAADAVVLVTEPMRSDFGARYPARAARMHTITNGFDPADYPGALDRDQIDHEPRLRLLHTGTLTLRRNAGALVEMLEGLRSQRGDLERALQIDCIGGRDAINDRLVRAAGLQGVIRFHPTQSHAAIVRRQRRAPALLLLDAGGAGSELTLPGKLFEYLGARRPVFALASVEGTGGVLRQTRAGVCFAPHDTEAAAAALGDWIDAQRSAPLPWRGDERALERYHRPRLAEHFAHLLDGVSRESAARTPRG